MGMYTKNPYEHLKIGTGETVSSEISSSWLVSESRDEKIVINASRLDSGFWVWGYMVNWASGRYSESSPSAKNGLFNSLREARLYAIGFMLVYLDYFTQESQNSLLKARASLAQSIFLF